jgi:phosphatidylinositol alpha-1,6-mannosyltransferase
VLKILYISHLHPPKGAPLENIGGMQNVSMQLTNELQKRQDVELKEIIMEASWANITAKTTGFLLSLLRRVPKEVKSFDPDVILFSSMVTAATAPLLKKRIDVPMVTINHGQDVTLPVSIYQWYVPRIFKALSGVISVSSATRNASLLRGLTPEKGVALPNGFDVAAQKDLPLKADAVKLLENEYNLSLTDKKVILTVGRQVKRKGHAWFIRNVMDKLPEDIVFILVGSGPESDAIARARNRSKSAQRIIITGKISDEMLQACYSAADLFVMPNIPVEGDMEGFGIVLLEANRAGVPAISADIEGMRDVIKQGVNGYRVPHSDAKEFARKITETLGGDLKALSESSKKYVVKNFSWNCVAEQYVNFLKNI